MSDRTGGGDGPTPSVADTARSSPAKPHHRGRAVLIGLAALAVVVLGAVLWLTVTGLRARTQLEAVRAQVHDLRAQIAAGDLTGARASAQALARHAAQAHELTTGPVWSIASVVPYFGRPAGVVRTVTSSIDEIAGGALPQLIDASRQLDPSTVRRADGSIDLAPIAKAVPALDAAAATMSTAARQIDASPGSTWLASVDSARGDLQRQLRALTSTVDSADVAARTVPALLGADGPKSYFVSFQNEAELRGLGGLPGAFAIVRTDHGEISFTRFESDGVLASENSGLRLDAQFRTLYARKGPFDPTRAYVNSTISPHFPYAARIWIAEWQHKSGQRLDGAFTLDPTAVSYLLAVTGPAHLPDGTTISAANVVEVTQQSAYDRFATDNTKRKQFLLDVALAVSGKLIGSTSNTTSLVRAAATAVGQHRLLAYSADPVIEAQLARTSIGGVMPVTAAPYAGLSLNNSMAGKLDYYLSASLDWRRTGCGAERQVTVTLTLTNNAPAALPAYVLGYYGEPGYPKHKGDNRQLVDYFATQGALLRSVQLNGRTAGVSVMVLRGHPVFRMMVPLPRGVRQTIVFHLDEPGGAGAPIVRAQPMIKPLRVSVHNTSCP